MAGSNGRDTRWELVESLSDWAGSQVDSDIPIEDVLAAVSCFVSLTLCSFNDGWVHESWLRKQMERKQEPPK